MPYKDKTKQQEYLKKHYQENKEKYKKASQKTKKKLQRSRRDWIYAIKEASGCRICGEKRGPCLVFHHLDTNTKEFNIASKAVGGKSKKKVMEEIEKCEILCANCHMMLHYEEIYKEDEI